MVIKVFVSGVSASNEVKKRQQRALLILDSVQVPYEVVDITEPGREDERLQLQQTCKSKGEGQDVNPLPPQFFNDQVHCGDYEEFNLAVDADTLLGFLQLDEGDDSVPRDIQTPDHAEVTKNHNMSEIENGLKEVPLLEDEIVASEDNTSTERTELKLEDVHEGEETLSKGGTVQEMAEEEDVSEDDEQKEGED